MSRQITRGIKHTRVSVGASAGTTDHNTTVLDMANYEGVAWIAEFGSISSSAVTSLKAQESSSTGSGFNDLQGTGVSITSGQSSGAVVLDVYRPNKRYVRAVVDRGTNNATLDGVMALQYGARRERPDTFLDDTGTVPAHEVHTSPTTGTA